MTIRIVTDSACDIPLNAQLDNVDIMNFHININDRDSRLFASQGQQRSIVLSLKLSEGEMIKEVFGEYPVFLLDDVLSELDYDRRKYLLDKKGEKQIIITSCQSEELKEIADKTIEVSGGVYT